MAMQDILSDEVVLVASHIDHGSNNQRLRAGVFDPLLETVFESSHHSHAIEPHPLDQLLE